ncbi:MAG: hypothetical protein AAFR46_20885, partial [Pseudomonadota bacterium]
MTRATPAGRAAHMRGGLAGPVAGKLAGPLAGAPPGTLPGKLPGALRPFVDFAGLLRANGFAVAPDQTIGFIQAIGLLGPRGLTDIYRAARALFAVPPEQVEAFDALFRAFFLGQTVSAPAQGDEGEEVEAHEASGADAAAELDPAEAPPG